jgi:hypothetical protein
MSETDKNLYFQEIARRFLARRGAPFILSGRELDLISSWDRAGIPLPVVFEGIERAFEHLRERKRGPGRGLSLAFCRTYVAAAFERHRDRQVGGEGASRPSRDRALGMRAEIDRFLAKMPEEVSFLKHLYCEARGKMAESSIPGESLERLDQKVERLLISRAGAAAREAAKKKILAEHGALSGSELEVAIETLLVKDARDKFKIPYLSSFYY